MLVTDTEDVPVSLEVVAAAVDDSMDPVVDDSAEDAVDEAVNTLSVLRVALFVEELSAVLAAPVMLPAVTIALYVGNAKPLPGGYCLVSEPEQQS